MIKNRKLISLLQRCVVSVCSRSSVFILWLEHIWVYVSAIFPSRSFYFSLVFAVSIDRTNGSSVPKKPERHIFIHSVWTNFKYSGVMWMKQHRNNDIDPMFFHTTVALISVTALLSLRRTFDEFIIGICCACCAIQTNYHTDKGKFTRCIHLCLNVKNHTQILAYKIDIRATQSHTQFQLTKNTVSNHTLTSRTTGWHYTVAVHRQINQIATNNQTITNQTINGQRE